MSRRAFTSASLASHRSGGRPASSVCEAGRCARESLRSGRTEEGWRGTSAGRSFCPGYTNGVSLGLIPRAGCWVASSASPSLPVAASTPASAIEASALSASASVARPTTGTTRDLQRGELTHGPSLCPGAHPRDRGLQGPPPVLLGEPGLLQRLLVVTTLLDERPRQKRGGLSRARGDANA